MGDLLGSRITGFGFDGLPVVRFTVAQAIRDVDMMFNG
jgi:hypothetical protein